jgi:phosphohistidine swiveling domain-containing protein
LGVYFKIIKELEELFIETNNYNEFSTVVELFIEDEIDKLFENSGLLKETLLLLASSQKKSFVEKYNLEIKKLNSWAKKEKVNLANFKKAKENKRFFEELRNVYRVGYFLNSSYAGVSFISIEDIFSDVVGFRNIKITNDINLDQLYLSLNDEQKKIIDISRYYSEQRDKRKEMQLKIFYLQARCIEEVSKIISIPRIDLENLRPCQFSEDFFDKKEALVDLINEQKKGLFFLSTDIGSFIESGDRASVLFNNVKLKESLGSRDIKGVVACRGRAKGVVRLLHNIHDNYFFEPGDILVTGMTSPNFIYVMKKAGAIVTDLGGTTCHAAIISRELDVPCIIGTKNATKILKDGDEVEVDADNGIVKIIKKYDKTKNS